MVLLFWKPSLDDNIQSECEVLLIEHCMATRQVFRISNLSCHSTNTGRLVSNLKCDWPTLPKHIFGYFILPWFIWLDFQCLHEVQWLSITTAMVAILLCFQHIMKGTRWLGQPRATLWARSWWTEKCTMFIEEFKDSSMVLLPGTTLLFPLHTCFIFLTGTLNFMPPYHLLSPSGILLKLP